MNTFRFPFVDISSPLAAWECTRQGMEVILFNSCNVGHEGFTYSPLWLTASAIPLGVGDTTVVGWCLDLLFLVSLGLVPPPRRMIELLIVLAATLSTTVVFALERANVDIMLFVLALATALLAGRGPMARLVGYSIALLSAALKYYPITVLIILFRERISIFVAVGLVALGSLVLFWAEYSVELAKGIPHAPHGPYNTGFFAAKNLPFLLGEVAGAALEPSSSAPLAARIVSGGLYLTLVCGCVAICWSLCGHLRRTLSGLTRFERVCLVIGSAVVVGCFFAGQSIVYRGVFLLLVIPGLLAITRQPDHELRNLSLGTSIVIVLLMWEECFRFALYRALEQSGASEILASEINILFWLIRELGWWWSVGVMLAVLVVFLADSPVLEAAASLFNRLALRAGPRLGAINCAEHRGFFRVWKPSQKPNGALH